MLFSKNESQMPLGVWSVNIARLRKKLKLPHCKWKRGQKELITVTKTVSYSFIFNFYFYFYRNAIVQHKEITRL